MDKLINYTNVFATRHTRDYYRGKSFHFAGTWNQNVHYINDEYQIDFVVHDGVLVACKKSHTSTIDNCPDDYIRDNNDFIIGIESNYWDFILAGAQAGFSFTVNENGNLLINGRTISNKIFSDENFTSAEKIKLSNIAKGAQVNVIEGVQVNGTDLTPSNKKVNIVLDDYATINALRTAISTILDEMPFAEGSGQDSAEQWNNTASGQYSFASGYNTVSGGSASHTEGTNTSATQQNAHAEGYMTTAAGINAHIEGRSQNKVLDTTLIKNNDEIITDWNSRRFSLAKGHSSHVEGYNNLALGNYSHAEGAGTIALGTQSHAEGQFTEAINNYEHAEGKFNVSIANVTQHTVGIGTSDSARKNAHLITNDGKHYIPGIGGYTGTETSLNGKTDLATFLNNFNATPLVEKTWSELKALRDGGNLVPGMQYRITDYNCTTVQENTQSVGHQFDIIVVADSTNTLNENARAIQHAEDTYFANSNLKAWELKYCLDNDTTKYAWADSTNGKGVIYWMKDEWNNECPYDFKNIQFKRSADWFSEHELWSENVLGRVPDEDMYFYTLSWVNEDGVVEDLSIVGQTLPNDEDTYDGIFGNKIGECTADTGVEESTTFALSGNVLVYTWTCDSGFFYGCRSNIFGNDCNFNTFGNSCNFNTFGNDCSSNTFGDDCSSNTFGNLCSSNTFGDLCTSNTFGNSCNFNTFGNLCTSNIFGNDCNFNTFGNSCNFNTFGNLCTSNIFGNSSGTKSYYRYITFESGNRYIRLYCSGTTSSSVYFQNVKIAQGVNNTTTYKDIVDSNVGQTYQTVYQPANSQVISV